LKKKEKAVAMTKKSNNDDSDYDISEKYKYDSGEEFDTFKFKNLDVKDGDTITIIKDDDEPLIGKIKSNKFIANNGTNTQITVKEVRKDEKTYKRLTNFEAGIKTIFNTQAVITETNIEFTSTTIDGKINTLSIPNKFKKQSMKDFLNLINFKDINDILHTMPHTDDKIEYLIYNTYQRYITDTKEFIGKNRINNLKNRRADKFWPIQKEILNKYIEKENPNFVIIYKDDNLQEIKNYTKSTPKDEFTTYTLSTLKQINPETNNNNNNNIFKDKIPHNRMRIPTDETNIHVLKKLFVREDNDLKFKYKYFKFIDCATTKIIPKQDLTHEHMIYHPQWGLFDNNWNEVNEYNVTVALKRLFNQIKLNQIIYIFHNDDDDDDKFIKVEQARLINMIDKWNFMNDKNDTDWTDNVLINDVDLITNRDDASLTVLYRLQYKKTVDPTEENAKSKKLSVFYKRESGHDENGNIKYNDLTELKNKYLEAEKKIIIKDVITSMAKNIKIEHFIENLETINKYPDMVERFSLLNNSTISDVSIGKKIIAGLSSGKDGISKLGKTIKNTIDPTAFHIEGSQRKISFANKSLEERKKILEERNSNIPQNGGAMRGGNINTKRQHFGKGIFNKVDFIYEMINDYYGCKRNGTCNKFANEDLNHYYTQKAKETIFYQKGGDDTEWTSDMPGSNYGIDAIPETFEALSTIRHKNNILYTDYKEPSLYRNPITVPHAEDQGINERFLYKWAHPINFGENTTLQTTYEIISALGNSLFKPSNPRGQSVAKYGVKNSRKILNENGITLAKKEGVNEHNIPFFLSNPNKFDTNSLNHWEAFNNIRDDPYDDNPVYTQYGQSSRKPETLLQEENLARHNKNAAVYNFGGNPNIFTSKSGEKKMSNDKLIEHIINVVLPNTQSLYLQPKGYEEEEAIKSRYYGEKSFI